MLERLLKYWVYATPPVALLLLGLYPFIGEAIAFPLFLALPVYMIHQYEEHDNDRFAAFLNGLMGGERRGLFVADFWIVNVIFVWFFLLGVFYLASVDAAWGVVAAYLLVINGLLHVGWAVRFRRYNPGLLTAVFLFLPCAAWIFIAAPATLMIHLVAALIVLILHASIMIFARRPAPNPDQGANALRQPSMD